MLGPIIQGEKICLEPSRPEFLTEYVRWFADTNVTRYLASVTTLSLKQEEEWFENAARDPNRVHWAIILDGHPIGNCGIQLIDWINRSALTGTIIGVPSEWGKGYGTEAVRLRTHFAFEELNLERLESESLTPNKGMHRALERSGYRQIGKRTRAKFRHGEWLDTYLFELLRSDWRPIAG